MPVPPRIYTPEQLADARYRYVETDETQCLDRAGGSAISERTLSAETSSDWGWERRRQSARKQMAQAAPAPRRVTPAGADA